MSDPTKNGYAKQQQWMRERRCQRGVWSVAHLPSAKCEKQLLDGLGETLVRPGESPGISPGLTKRTFGNGSGAPFFENSNAASQN